MEREFTKLLGEQTATLHRDIDQDVSVLVSRFDTVYASICKLQRYTLKEFDPEVTLIAQGLPQSPNEDIIQEERAIVNQVLNEPDSFF